MSPPCSALLPSSTRVRTAPSGIAQTGCCASLPLLTLLLHCTASIDYKTGQSTFDDNVNTYASLLPPACSFRSWEERLLIVATVGLFVVALTCRYDDVLGYIVLVLLSISIAGALLTLLTFLIFPKIRTYPIKLIMYLCLVIIIGTRSAS